MSDSSDRRAFIGASSRALGGFWLWTHPALAAAVSACARDAALGSQSFQVLTSTEAAALRAFAARIFPSDELPGAEEAGAIHFIDAALGGFAEGMTTPVRALAAGLDDHARQRGSESFAALAEPAQDEVISSLEGTVPFDLGRTLVLMGVLADPAHGGNRNHAATELVGIEHAPAWRPPFGYYDAAAASPPAAEG